MARTTHINELQKEPSELVIGTYVFSNCQLIRNETYGTIYKAYDVDQQECFAIKVIKLDSRDGIPSHCLREISILKEISHPNIVKVLDFIPNNGFKSIYMIYEHADYDLKTLIDKLRPGYLPIQYIKSFLCQILRALALCHISRVLHRDLKPESILVANNGNVKITDFGLARSFNIPSRCYTHEVVTLWYRAPEILLHAKFYTTAVDIWSVACIFAELVRSKPLFQADSEISQLYTIFKIMGTPTEKIWPDFTKCIDYKVDFPLWENCFLSDYVSRLDDDGLDLLAQMLSYAPEERINAKAALSHPFLRNLPSNLEPITTLFVKDESKREEILD
ncbi:unnamed protein product [Thelazia callipaeda]|uniref:cyclin-dependent kinase n=1 Tax=Thelazia callipaeda TaxID=103827 RepID=A0A0N5CYJ5_THECL|nr:unnamed protein product [Thelazia callipaeda]